MIRRWLPAFLFGLVGLGLWLGGASPARAQGYGTDRFYHYPYYYFPHNYWPSMAPKWPEPIGASYMPPPAYMAYPPYLERHWRYELWAPQLYYRGSHFWLDQF